MKRLGVFVLVLALLAATIVPAFVITADFAKAAGSSAVTTGGGSTRAKRCAHTLTYNRKVVTNWAQPNIRTVCMRNYCKKCGQYLKTHAYYERYISNRWTKWIGSDCWYVERSVR